MAENIHSTYCPIPDTDFDVINVGHGSGGILTHQLLRKCIFSILNNEFLAEQHDGAILQFTRPVAFTTDSFVITPIFFPGGNIGELAVNGSINDLAMCGAVPEYLSLSFILEEGLRMDEFYEVVYGIKRASQKAGVLIVTGDTKVVERGKGDKIFINTTGLGHVHPKAGIHAKRVKPGDAVLISGPIARHGVAILSVRQGLEFETTITSDTRPLHWHTVRLLDEIGGHVHFLRDPTRGGVATVLSELAEQSGTGVEINQNDIPLDDEVEGACEMLGLDPLYVANEGIFIAIVAPEKTEDALAILKEFDSAAAAIGVVTGHHPGQVILNSRAGGKRIINMLPGEQLPRIC